MGTIGHWVLGAIFTVVVWVGIVGIGSWVQRWLERHGIIGKDNPFGT